MSVRARRAAWAADLLADPRLVVLDTETTDFDGYICEIAVLDRRGGALLDELVDPQEPVSPGAQRVHGLSNAMLAGKPTFKDVWPRLRCILATRRVVGWNARFDHGVIAREMYRAGLDDDDLAEWEDAMAPYSDWQRDMYDAPWQKLNGGHRAAEDCRAVITRLEEMEGSA